MKRNRRRFLRCAAATLALGVVPSAALAAAADGKLRGARAFNASLPAGCRAYRAPLAGERTPDEIRKIASTLNQDSSR